MLFRCDTSTSNVCCGDVWKRSWFCCGSDHDQVFFQKLEVVVLTYGSGLIPFCTVRHLQSCAVCFGTKTKVCSSLWPYVSREQGLAYKAPRCLIYTFVAILIAPKFLNDSGLINIPSPKLWVISYHSARAPLCFAQSADSSIFKRKYKHRRTSLWWKALWHTKSPLNVICRTGCSDGVESKKKEHRNVRKQAYTKS